MIDISDVQRYMLSFMASPLSLNMDCSDLADIVDKVQKDKDNVEDDR